MGILIIVCMLLALLSIPAAVILNIRKENKINKQLDLDDENWLKKEKAKEKYKLRISYKNELNQIKTTDTHLYEPLINGSNCSLWSSDRFTSEAIAKREINNYLGSKGFTVGNETFPISKLLKIELIKI